MGERRIRSLKVLSLFSGAGGMDLGFEGGFKIHKNIAKTLPEEWVEAEPEFRLVPTGFTTVFANDIRPDAKTAWEKYFKTKDIYKLGSIVDLVKAHASGENIFPENIDIITGGFPCQDFSIAGKREGFKSTNHHHLGKVQDDTPSIENRGQLYIWMKEVIDIVKPKLFIAENVKGLVSLKNVQKTIEKDFSKNGYLVIPAKVLQAADFGVPQSRERIFFIGFRKDALTDEALIALQDLDNNAKYDPYPTPTHNFLKGVFTSTSDVLSDLAEPETSTDTSQQKFSKAKYRSNGQGQTEIKLDGVSPTIRSEHHGNIEFRRLSKEHGGKNLSELDKGLRERRLTVRECATLQTFPEDYDFIIAKSSENVALSASNAYKLIGNAVPPLLAYNLARSIKDKWDLYFK